MAQVSESSISISGTEKKDFLIHYKYIEQFIEKRKELQKYTEKDLQSHTKKWLRLYVEVLIDYDFTMIGTTIPEMQFITPRGNIRIKVKFEGFTTKSS